jgi:hypothetical protein
MPARTDIRSSRSPPHDDASHTCTDPSWRLAEAASASKRTCNVVAAFARQQDSAQQT